MAAEACQLKGIVKAFGPNRVLRGIDLVLKPGEITVLMGANGAGKSTLVKILCGVHRADGGEMRLFGEPYAPTSPSEAIAKGVVTVHQSIDDGVIPDLDVASNLLLDRLTNRSSGFFVAARAMREEAAKIAAAMGLDLDPSAIVGDLGVAERQLIAIARAMAREPKVLILDEPTSSLSAAEADRLFRLLDRLKETGVAILYISHRMSDIRRVADRIVSMRDGQIAGMFEGEALDYEGAVTAMLGHGLTAVDVAVKTGTEPVLSLDGLRLFGGSKPVDLQIRQGEVVAVTGLLGSGKTRLASVLFGLEQPVAGTMRLRFAHYAPQTARDAIRAGVFLCPKDRASNGVIRDFDITDNLTLPFLSRHAALSFLNPRRQRRRTEEMIATLGIVCQGPGDGIGTLSGGNQQKVMVGRWMAEASNLLVLDEPFQGVDIKARRDIGRRIRETAETRATLVFVAEIDEALEIADRIVVLNEGEIVGEHPNRDVDVARIMAEVSGQTAPETVT
ncbi:ATP-binding cassette domain-containing protein [Alphaproteobacteria bacterium GH1-50]|uniref:Autoinducer 2 import ATP-binding protein LsrA n=1 Tax=Kangsaoukella pontilimi TaxID=2691042 RepID=A0A7C9MC72_9RHOB|nr:sugar ABC transporter ATP-binding protein [Kangsaoukella pontilimi]MXQ09213.1 ATP-binding cassette domain-containing protein [Kangsaoukella pontilimi]